MRRRPGGPPGRGRRQGRHRLWPAHDPLRADDEILAQIPDCIEAGSASFKLYMAYEGLRLDDGGLLLALAALRKAGGRVLVHAENHHAIVYLTAQALAEGRTGPREPPPDPAGRDGG